MLLFGYRNKLIPKFFAFMSFIVTAVAFLLIFSILVLIHEGGHYFAARLSGIKVEEFGLGLPPRAWGKRRGETIYSINWVPFGGFVRLLGESGGDPKMLKNKASFIAKSARARIFVVSAGVMMNYILAIFLLTIGFIVGIEPLVVDYDDFLTAIEEGSYVMNNGVLIDEVTVGGIADQKGFERGDRIVSINDDTFITADILKGFISGERSGVSEVKIERNGETRLIRIEEEGDLGVKPYTVFGLFRLVVAEVEPGSRAFNAGVLPGDVILKINDTQIYGYEDYEKVKRSSNSLRYTLLRDGVVKNIHVDYPEHSLLTVSNVYSDTPARRAGLVTGDVIVSVNGKPISKSSDLVDEAKNGQGRELAYQIFRRGQSMVFNITPDKDGLIGVSLANMDSYSNDDLGIYETIVQESLVDVKNVQYPLLQAPGKAFNECNRLAVLTVDMAGNLIRSVITKFQVPEGVAGPVGIVRLTHTFAQQGIWSLLRFMALLSLSLAIINILPLPALDGGRLLFILIEVLTGRRINQRFESMIHTVGFVLLMILIVIVSYNDILRFF